MWKTFFGNCLAVSKCRRTFDLSKSKRGQVTEQKTVMETKELRKAKRELKQIGDKINATANRVNKGLVTEFGDGSKWIEFNHFLFDGSQVIYKLDEYEEYLLDTDKDIKDVTTLSYKEYHDLRRSVGITKEYCVEPKKK